MHLADRPSTLFLARATAGASLAVLATQITGWNRVRIVSIAQSFTPMLAVAGLPVAAVAVAGRRRGLAAAALVGSGGLAAIVAPALRGHRPDTAGPRRPVFRIAHANMLYTNIDRAPETAAAVFATDADILAMSEFTAHHERALEQLDNDKRYPHRYDWAEDRDEGVAIWSKQPLDGVVEMAMDTRPGITATFDLDGSPVRLVFAHPDPPTLQRGLRRWRSSLTMIGDLAGQDGNVGVVVADLNASRWHPVLRELIGRGFRDAHEAVGRGLSASWPTDSRFVPPFVRLDHALVGRGLDVVATDDFDLPGSDHRGFVVTVALAAAN